MSLAVLDLAYHALWCPLASDAVRKEVMARTQHFAFQPGTPFQATFGHLMGYDAGYYGYQWALSLAQDMLTRFHAAGMFDPTVAAEYRAKVLARGAGADEQAISESFLGRPSDLRAYGRYLSAGVVAEPTPAGSGASGR